MSKIISLILITVLNSALAESTQENRLEKGQAAFQSLCSSCHSEPGNQPRLAPPVFAIKSHYISDDTDEAAFTQAITDFVLNPQQENAKMLGAVKKFGVMPQMGFAEEQIKQIASYFYHGNFQPPNGQHGEKHHQQTNQSALSQGQQHAMAAKALLGKNLMTAINTEGTVGALQFCNENALKLTETAAKQNGVSIKRVSDKNRNPKNRANESELAYINETKELLKKGEKISGQINVKDNKLIGYYPITTNAMCLQCHGQPNKDIQTETIDAINSLYPNDLATGYGINELRGIWVIEMEQ
ncbi:MAG: DUF3365 domain-containing protein [Marinicella sp.]